MVSLWALWGVNLSADSAIGVSLDSLGFRATRR